MTTFVLSIITVLVLILASFIVILTRHRRFSHIAFFLGMLSTAAVIFGDSLCMLKPELLYVWKRIVFMAEAAMAISWLLFSISFARIDFWKSAGRFTKIILFVSPLFIAYFTALPTGKFYYSPEFNVERILFLDNTGYIFNLILLLYSVVSVVNLEATLRNTSGVGKWQIKYILMGVGSIIAMNIFYYSYALLYRALNMNLLPVRDGVILIASGLIFYSVLKHKVVNIEVAISRRVLYRSLSIFIVGIYLLWLGIIGEGMRYFGPQVGKNITIFFGFVGAILVLTILLSEQLRRKAIVFISKNFYSHKYDYREQWLHFTQRISLKHTFEELLESIAEGFKEAIGSYGVSVWLKDRDKGEYVCVKVLDSSMVHVRPNRTLLDFLQNRDWIVNAHDKYCKEVVSENKEFLKKTETSLIVPLNHVGKLIGFIILREGLANYHYNYEDYDLLKTLAKQATLAIMNAQLSEELTEAKEMEAMGRLSSFIIHDLKNAASMLSLVVQNAEEHIDNPDFRRDAIRTVYNSSEKIKDIIGKLKNLPRKTQLVLEYSDLGACVRSAINQVNLNGNSEMSFRETEAVFTKVDKDEIIKVIINLIMNAIDASERKAEIKIAVGTENGMAFIRVSDKGCGMSPDFIEKKLFKPFHTTKKKGLGIGLFQCKTIVEAHSGQLMVDSREGKGTDFVIYLPIAS